MPTAIPTDARTQRLPEREFPAQFLRQQRFLAEPLRMQNRHPQRGYALLLIMFFVAILAATAMTVAPNILTQGRREREQEMIWRGKQYARGVKLFDTKLGHYPTSLDDLTQPKTGSIRFMRQAYKDPMNKEDGSWRLIYIGPAGQLIGSLKPPENLQQPGTGGLGTSAAAVASASGQSSSASSGFGSSSGSGFGSGNSSSFGSSSSSGFGSSSFGSSNSSGFGSASSFGSFANNGQPGDPNVDPYLDPPVANLPDTSNVVGGNIIGVGSKINQHSIMVYQKAKNYLLFEFVWNPAADAAAALQQGLNAPGSQGIGTPVGNGQTPFGQTPATGTSTGQGGTTQGGTPTPQQPQPQNPPQQ